MNVDYSKKETKKRSTHDTIGYQEVLITGNLQSAIARVEIGFDVEMRVSVYMIGCPLHKGVYVTHCAVKGTITVEVYSSL